MTILRQLSISVKTHVDYSFKLFIIFMFFSSSFFFASAQNTNTFISGDEATSPHYRISILTCGAGDELYSSFGHTGIRVINQITGSDEVYNYGTFDFSDPDFYTKFTLGKLDYYLSKSPYQSFTNEYVQEGRSIKEQTLNLSQKETQTVIAFLKHNILPENRAYKYDFLYDNCATRVRDIFPDILGGEFKFANILQGNEISYREIIDQYLANKHWQRLGINLLLGSRIDSSMSNESIMFLPDFIYIGLENGKYKNDDIVKESKELLPNKVIALRRPNGPLWTMIGLLIITMLAFHVKAFAYLKPILQRILLFTTGILGFLMLFMWLGTNHQSCRDNYNILWALPINLIVAFLPLQSRYWLRFYALFAISLLIVTLAVHIIGLQKFPLIEILPLLLSLMYIYLEVYKNASTLQQARNND